MNHLPFTKPFAATRILTGLTAVSVIAGMIGYTNTVIARNNLIEPEEAASFALIDAGVREADAEDLHSVREYQNGQYVYRIQFSADNTQYTCIVEAKDGIVLAREPEDAPAAGNVSKTEEAAQPVKDVSAAETADTVQNESPAEAAPSTEQAAEPADLTAGEAPETLIPEKDPEAESPETEQKAAENSGKENESPKTFAASHYITVDKAKQIALSAAGFREEDVIISTSKLEKDDDYGHVYEIEFYRGNVEYEFEIDAVTGTIVESSKEIEDDDDD